MRLALIALASALSSGMIACGSSAAPSIDAGADAQAADAQVDATPPVACSAGPTSGESCASMSETCAIAGGGCCVCGGAEGLCAQLWVCATPSTNDADCPVAQPPQDSDCATATAAFCDYCGTDGVPVRAECINASTYLPCQQAGLARCWHASDQGAGCD